MRLPGIANLETRRKRRESSHHPEVGQSRSCSETQSQYTLAADASIAIAKPLKSGAKRKLNVRDDDEANETVKEMEPQILKLNRNLETSKTTVPERSPTGLFPKCPTNLEIVQRRGSDHPHVSSHQALVKDTISKSAVQARKALGPSRSSRFLVCKRE